MSGWFWDFTRCACCPVGRMGVASTGLERNREDKGGRISLGTLVCVAHLRPRSLGRRRRRGPNVPHALGLSSSSIPQLLLAGPLHPVVRPWDHSGAQGRGRARAGSATVTLRFRVLACRANVVFRVSLRFEKDPGFQSDNLIWGYWFYRSGVARH